MVILSLQTAARINNGYLRFASGLDQFCSSLADVNFMWRSITFHASSSVDRLSSFRTTQNVSQSFTNKITMYNENETYITK